VVDLEQLTTTAVEDLSTLEPFGHGHPAPRFCVRDVELKASSAFGGDGDHLRLWFGHGDKVVEAIGWRRGHFLDSYRRAGNKGARLDAIFSVEINRWDGDASVRLELQDVRLAEAVSP
jgi:single-stranded-DNA-specific exonuclease